MRSSWAEQRDGPIKLEDEHPEIFQIYVHWLYRRTIAVDTSTTFSETLVEEMRRVLDLAENSTSVKPTMDTIANQPALSHQSEEVKEEKKVDDHIIICCVRALIMGETLMDDDFMTVVEERLVSLIHSGSHFEPRGPLGHFIWKTSAQYSRPRRIVVARTMTIP